MHVWYKWYTFLSSLRSVPDFRNVRYPRTIGSDTDGVTRVSAALSFLHRAWRILSFRARAERKNGGASAQVMSRRTARYSIPLTNRHNPDKKRPSCRSHAASTECFGETARWFYDASVVSLRENKAEPQRDAEAPDRPSAKSAGSPAALQFRNHNRAGAVAGDTI